jgi:hypothetical protein
MMRPFVVIITETITKILNLSPYETLRSAFQLPRQDPPIFIEQRQPGSQFAAMPAMMFQPGDRERPRICLPIK